MRLAGRIRAGLVLALTFALLFAASTTAVADGGPFPLDMIAGGHSIFAACEDGSATISGTVQDADGNAVEGADVFVATEAEAGMFEQAGFAATDEEGNYAVESLCAGDYIVGAIKEGDDLLIGIHDADGDDSPDLVALAEDDSAADAIDITLSAMADFPGGGEPAPSPEAPCEAPEAIIRGRVTDESGAGVADASVLVMAEWYAMVVVADADGRYEADELCAGDYHVFADGLVGERWMHGTHDADGDGAPDVVALDADDTLAEGIDVELDEESGRGGGPIAPCPPGGEPLPPGAEPFPPACENPEGSISGTVTDADGNPVAGVEIVALGAGAENMATSAEDGTYEIDDLCSGEYLILAWSETADGVSYGVYDVDGDGEPDPVTLDADDASASDIDIQLEMHETRGGTPGGGGIELPELPECDSPSSGVSGTVRTVDGEALAGADVFVGVLIDEHAVAAVGMARTNEEGAYSVEGLCAGEYIVGAFAESDGELLMGVYDTDGDGEPDALTLAADEQRAGVDIEVAGFEIPGGPEPIAGGISVVGPGIALELAPLAPGSGNVVVAPAPGTGLGPIEAPMPLPVPGPFPGPTRD